MARIKATVWANRDNVIELVLRDVQGTLVTSLAAVTRAVAVIGSTAIDSAVDATAIWWTDTETRTLSIDGEDVAFTGAVLKMRLGHSGLAAGKYTGCCLILFDADDNDDGTTWADDMEITVKSVCPLTGDPA